MAPIASIQASFLIPGVLSSGLLASLFVVILLGFSVVFVVTIGVTASVVVAVAVASAIPVAIIVGECNWHRADRCY